MAATLTWPIPYWHQSLQLLLLKSFDSESTIPTTIIVIFQKYHLVTVGDPQDFSKTTLLLLGPNVTFTASARVLIKLLVSMALTS